MFLLFVLLILHCCKLFASLIKVTTTTTLVSNWAWNIKCTLFLQKEPTVVNNVHILHFFQLVLNQNTGLHPFTSIVNQNSVRHPVYHISPNVKVQNVSKAFVKV